MLWAEHKEKGQNVRPTRIRDFRKTFEKCEIDVKEYLKEKWTESLGRSFNPWGQNKSLKKY